MKRYHFIVLAALFLGDKGVMAAPDAGVDAGADAGTDAGAACLFGEAECASDPWMWCDSDGQWVVTDCFGSEEAPLAYSPCNCAPEDPCGWSGDTICDVACLDVVDTMFDDSFDCAPELDGGADSDSDSDADTDADTDTDTDTASDASLDDVSGSGCSCAVSGRPLVAALLSRLF
jgi:hypothetical protein